ncbi:hypothetical protein FA95DRAFT_1546775 [Auriscalpium vulgare]|uniref:Uncharacterized protein n=1 Tax=Auriscalpium vulgare TaxID=40419 RepID=A0ACB8RFX2_9AGAM|nr:hypothetical protein FA95DRAFT_1546775 [Auriscalpium vulgare]
MFFKAIPTLMKGLDAVADLHPIIQAPVLVFKTVYTLERKRRDNEKKVIILYTEMQEMMAVLMQLKDVRDDKLFAPDNTVMKDRLVALISQTAEDIKDCSNACDAYSKKSLFAKVFQGPMWDETLLGFVELFTKRRTEFQFALGIHTAQGVDGAKAALGSIEHTTQELQKKMDAMIALFQQLVSPEQKALMELVNKLGGAQAVLRNDAALKTVLSSLTPAPTPSELKEELGVSKDAALKENLVVFTRKFEAQQQEIEEEDAPPEPIRPVGKKPHDRILDKAMRSIWKEMGWRGHVKGRDLILALRDHYAEHLLASPDDQDAWAITFIDLMWLQPILEAFGDEASGFITVAQINAFTTSRPADWSLPYWIAYWAVGWHASLQYYAAQIETLFARMEGLRAHLLPANRPALEHYLSADGVWFWAHGLLAPLTPALAPASTDEVALEASRVQFAVHGHDEERRLARGLGAVGYVLDGEDALALVAGSGRVETFALPVLYLLVRRHFEIMCVARTKVLAPREVPDAIESVRTLKRAMEYRKRDLQNVFRHHGLDPQIKLAHFAHGMFQYTDDDLSTNALWTPEYVATLRSPVIPSNDASENPAPLPQHILQYAAVAPPKKRSGAEVPAVHRCWCRACKRPIVGARIVCVDCPALPTVDFCAAEACMAYALAPFPSADRGRDGALSVIKVNFGLLE